MSHKRKKLIATVLVVFLVACGLFFLTKTSTFYSKIYTAHSAQVTPQKNKTIYSVLLLGYGGGTHAGTYLTDSMMLISIDTKTKKTTLISLPRDMWVKIPTISQDEFYTKINSVYQMGMSSAKRYPDLADKYKGLQGSANLLKLIVETISGIPVDYYLAVDFNGFIKAVDILGGVDVEVSRSFEDITYPVDGKEDDECGFDQTQLNEAIKIATESPELAFPCRYENLSFQSGTNHMDGSLALKYVRSRNSSTDGGDFNRARRQQEFIKAVENKVTSIGFIPKIIPLMNELQNHIRTDIPFDTMRRFTQLATSFSSYTSTSIVLSTDNLLTHAVSSDGQYILVPKTGIDTWKSVRDGIDLLIKNKYPTPTP